MLKTIWAFILRLFGVAKTATTDAQLNENTRYAGQYEDISKINFTAIFANKLTTLAVSESTADVTGGNARAEYLAGCLGNVWSRIKRITARALGTGGCAVVPYVRNGKLLFDIITQDRIVIHEKQGDAITAATVLADCIKLNAKVYYRWTDYRVQNGVLRISNRTTNESGNAATVEQWNGIKDMTIQGVDRVLFAYLKSPVDNRAFGDVYGVPVTYGCDWIIKDIYECLMQIQDEFELKQVRVFADERMFRRNPKTGEPIMPSKLFFAASGASEKTMLDIFSPDIRDSSYYNRLLSLFDLLEKAVGTSKGILTAPETRGATATEIKAGLYDTYAMVTDIRAALETAIRDYIYACNVLANYYGLAPQGEYEVAFDWSYSMIESSAETWSQMKDAQAMGVKSKAEVRQWISPNETIEESQKKIEEIQRTEPSLQDLIGG